MAGPSSVIVVGAGIIGASIAWYLTRAGATVTVLAEEAGGVATPNSFAWINASWGNPEPYFRLRLQAMAEWQRLADALPGLQLALRGGLCWDLPAPELDRYAEEQASWGYAIRYVDHAEISEIEPNLAMVPEKALFAEQEGAVEAATAARLLLSDAAGKGAAVRRTTVSKLVCRNGRITGVETGDGPLRADAVVLAAGAGTCDLAVSIGIDIPLETPPGLLVHSCRHEPLIGTVITAPDLHMRQTADGRVVAGGDFGGSAPGAHPERSAAALFDRVRDALRGADDLALDFHTIGYRPTPTDGFPIVGTLESHPGAYIAVTHSGVTLAPVLGLFAAQEILTGHRDPLLAPYSPARFA